jgi:C1A family cysteine protease
MLSVLAAVSLTAIPQPALTAVPFNLTQAAEAFELFAASHHREQDTQIVRLDRKAQFIKRWQFVVAGNALAGMHAFKINGLADYTDTEMKALTQGYIPQEHKLLNRNYELERRARADLGLVEELTTDSIGQKRRMLATALDWTSQNGVVTPIQNQGSCGDCWAFAAAASYESQYNIANIKAYSTNGNLKFSEQQILDCSSEGDGCNGGNMNMAAVYYQNFGLSTINDPSDTYPGAYDQQQETCKKAGGFYKAAYHDIPATDLDVQAIVNTYGPVAIGMFTNDAFWSTSGDPNSPVCTATSNLGGVQGAHAITIVGWGTGGGGDYWKIKNSWGSGWGDDGWGYIARGNSACGLPFDATYTIPSTMKNSDFTPVPAPSSDTCKTPYRGVCDSASGDMACKGCDGTLNLFYPPPPPPPLSLPPPTPPPLSFVPSLSFSPLLLPSSPSHPLPPSPSTLLPPSPDNVCMVPTLVSSSRHQRLSPRQVLHQRGRMFG